MQQECAGLDSQTVSRFVGAGLCSAAFSLLLVTKLEEEGGNGLQVTALVSLQMHGVRAVREGQYVIIFLRTYFLLL